MQRLRTSIATARAVLAWFALSLAVAMAAPVFKPLVTEFVCGAHGVAAALPGDDGVATPQAKVLECPACGWLGAAPPLALAFDTLSMALPSWQPPFLPVSPHTLARLAPMPARGPPTLLVLLNS